MGIFKDALVEARSIMTGTTAITDIVGTKVYFGARPQGTTDECIVMEAEASEYEATQSDYAKAVAWRAVYRFYSDNMVQLAEMVDLMKDAVVAHSSTDFEIRPQEEGLVSDADGKGIAYLIVRILRTDV